MTEDLDEINNSTTEELVLMDSINAETHDCSFENNSDLQQAAELQSESRDNSPLTLSVNTVSYKRLLDKEKVENYTSEVEISNHHSEDAIIVPLTSTTTFIQKLKRIKEQVHSSWQVFLSLVK